MKIDQSLFIFFLMSMFYVITKLKISSSSQVNQVGQVSAIIALTVLNILKRRHFQWKASQIYDRQFNGIVEKFESRSWSWRF